MVNSFQHKISGLVKKPFKVVTLRIACILFFIFFLVVSYLRTSFNNAYKEALTNPRFGLTGADTEILRIKVEELKESVANIAGSYGNENESRLIETSLHPLDFLGSLPELEDARRAFIAGPTVKNFFVYESALKRTLAKYRKDLGNYLNALQNLSHTFPNEFYHYGTNAITREKLIADVSAMAANAEVLERESIPDFSVSEKNGGREISLSTFSPKERADLAFTDKLIMENNWRKVMPLVEVATNCIGDPKLGETDLFYLVGIDKFMAPLAIRQQFFHFSLSNLYDNDRRHKPMREAGFEYTWQQNFNYYFCPDVSYYAEIFTLYKIREILAEWRESGQSTGFPELTAAVDEFLKADLISAKMQFDLMRIIRKTLEDLTGPEISEKAGGDTERILRDILLIYRQKSGYFEELIRRGVAMNRGIIKINSQINKPLEVKELFITRSFPALYFMPYNGSVWGGERLFSPDYYGETKYYMEYSALKNIYSVDKLIKLINLSFGLTNRQD